MVMNRLSAIAAHRFGLGEAQLQTVGNSPQYWLLDQIGPADPAPGLDLVATEQMLRDIRGRRSPPRSTPEAPPAAAPGGQEDKQRFRELISADVRSRLIVGIQTQRPFAERLFFGSPIRSAT